jgi:hypothetical protein
MVEDEKHQFDAEVIEGVLQSKDPITKPIRIPRSSSPQSCPLCPNLENVSEFTQSQAKSGSGVKVWGNTSLWRSIGKYREKDELVSCQHVECQSVVGQYWEERPAC